MRLLETWVITKAVRIKGRPVCWRIPVEVKTGKQVTITLNKDNTFDLQTPDDDAMKNRMATVHKPRQNNECIRKSAERKNS
jgi:hypothetical protein